MPHANDIVFSRSLIGVVLVVVSASLSAQTEEVAHVCESAAALIDDVRAELECDISTTGAPRFDEFSNAWLVAFTAAGPDCDEAAAALTARGRQVGATFYRRPDRADRVAGRGAAAQRAAGVQLPDLDSRRAAARGELG